MEMVVGVEKSVEGIYRDGAVNNTGLAPSKQDADPVVYKLVRVDFDGRFVPATDDELMEVESLLESEKNEMLSIPDVMGTIGHILNKNETPGNPLLEKHEGLSQIELTGVVKENVRAQAEDLLPTLTSNSEDRNAKDSRNTGEESSSTLQTGLSKSGSTGSQPNFSLIKGEINLDVLTIRELHETFRATFGRRTSVKDKMWLKRRIAMGLTNTCDVSVASFVINDGKLIKKKEELSKSMDDKDSVAGEICNGSDDGLVNLIACPNLRGDNVDDTDLKNSLMESGCRSDDNLESRAAKRVRKPTKRYIEELSDREKDSCVKSVSSSKHLEEDKSSPRATVRPARVAFSGDFVTRSESIRGSGIQVPFVSRIRRCRPRKSMMTLTNFISSDASLVRKVVGSSVEVGRSPLYHDHIRVKVETEQIPLQEAIVSEEMKEKQCLSNSSNISQAREPRSVDSEDNTPPQDNASGNSSDNHIATIPAASGGMRRKHHRAWSLTEVTKLVDGVAKFGAGRWSEIKRLSFASYSHRTPVDLKDKWRNLLKASFANSQADKGANVRKNAPLPIPAAILLRVKELAELNGQAPPVKASSNNSGSSVNENRSRYL